MKFVTIVIGSNILSFVIGIYLSGTFLGGFLDSATTSRMIADATINTTVIEMLNENDVQSAKSLLKSELDTSLIGIEAAKDTMSESEIDTVNKLRARIEKFENK
jgi:hypothetical protein